jgi:3-phosphoshikimate 1-carboxyvinyltransferase
MCCFASGKSTIRGVKRLRFKESDRLASLISELSKMGAKVRTEDDAIVVEGVERIHSAELESHGDHRIAMAGVVAGLKAEGTTVVHGIECINKSYPDFVRNIALIGGRIIER